MRVRFFANLRTITGCAEADLPFKETAGALARSLCELYGEALRKKIFPSNNSGTKRAIDTEEKFSPEIMFMINGRHVDHLGGVSAPLHPDDELDIFPVLGGG